MIAKLNKIFGGILLVLLIYILGTKKTEMLISPPSWEVLNAPRPIEGIDTVWIEEMTWMEVRDAIKSGSDTVIVGSGGVEQNGPYLELGKHNIILRRLSELVARRLGKTLVAPVIAFVPEGDIDTPTDHMFYPGTLSVTDETFEALLTDVCKSLAVHGFKHIVLIGDSYGNQLPMKSVAKKLNDAGLKENSRVHYIPEYYDYAVLRTWLHSKGVVESDQGFHDDFVFTAMLMAIDPKHVRAEQRIKAGNFSINGVDLTQVERVVALGNEAIERRVEQTVAAIQKQINGT